LLREGTNILAAVKGWDAGIDRSMELIRDNRQSVRRRRSSRRVCLIISMATVVCSGCECDPNQGASALGRLAIRLFARLLANTFYSQRVYVSAHRASLTGTPRHDTSVLTQTRPHQAREGRQVGGPERDRGLQNTEGFRVQDIRD
jgi:hypothetical protein